MGKSDDRQTMDPWIQSEFRWTPLALGTCSLSVRSVSSEEREDIPFEFTAVEGLGHESIFGWDFLQLNRAVLYCYDVISALGLFSGKHIHSLTRNKSMRDLLTGGFRQNVYCFVSGCKTRHIST